jgi:hypothetical protein
MMAETTRITVIRTTAALVPTFDTAERALAKERPLPKRTAE